jgi:glutathione-regulated potassium-efflux system ancillary protein KefG
VTSRILILFAHPALHRSRANAALADAVRSLPGVTFHDLYAAYPHHLIDVPHEQDLLRSHDVVVWQHPFYWYAAPSLLKEWQDVVLEHGFAYGEDGTALRGKRMLSVLTTGGPATAYQPDGYNRYTMRQLLAPFDQTAHLCGMTYLEPFLVHGVRQLTREELQSVADQYRQRIERLRDGRPEPAWAQPAGGTP